MRYRIVCLCALLATLLAAVACSSQGAPTEATVPPGPLVIRNGTLIDGNGADPMPDGIVIIEGDRIVAAGREADIAIPSNARIIDAKGGTILPGLIDSHVHDTWSPEVRREFLELGVTSVCDLGSPIERMDEFEQDAWNGKPVARGFRAGPIFTAPGGLPDAVLHADLNYEVGTREEARSGVADVVSRGADVIKVYLQPTANNQPYPMLDDAVLKAIVEAAHSHGVMVRAHVTKLSLVPMALDAGVNVLEHVPERPLSEESFVRVVEASDDLSADLFDWYIVADYDTLLPRIATQGVLMVPTMALLVEDRYGSRETIPWQRVMTEGLLEIVRRFHSAGGVIALGTDYNSQFKPSIAIQEAQLLHVVGLTPVQVIEAATKNAAWVCGHGEDLGTIEVGKLADVIIVDGNLVTDLEALNQVVIVVKGGQVAYRAG